MYNKNATGIAAGGVIFGERVILLVPADTPYRR